MACSCGKTNIITLKRTLKKKNRNRNGVVQSNPNGRRPNPCTQSGTVTAKCGDSSIVIYSNLTNRAVTVVVTIKNNGECDVLLRETSASVDFIDKNRSLTLKITIPARGFLSINCLGTKGTCKINYTICEE